MSCDAGKASCEGGASRGACATHGCVPNCPSRSGAFSIYELTPSNINKDDPAQLGGCVGPPFDVAQIDPNVVAELNCIFTDYEAEGEGEGGKARSGWSPTRVGMRLLWL